MQFTERQQQAIKTKQHNILVNAAAGSGKTAVLVERLFQQILAGQTLDSFIVITFTKLAASEMKERLAKRLSEALLSVEQESELYHHLAYVESQIPTCHISTIDAFCSFIVREYGYMLPSITKQLSLVDSVDAERMNHEAFLEFAEVMIKTPEYLELGKQFMDIRDLEKQKLLSMLLTITPEFANVADHQRRYEELLLMCKPLTAIEQLPLFSTFLQRQKCLLADMSTDELTYFAYSERYERDIEQLNQLLTLLKSLFEAEVTYVTLQSALQDVKIPRKPAVPKDEQDPETEERYKKTRERLKKQIDAICAPFQKDAEVETTFINDARMQMQILIDMAYAFYTRTQQKRLARGKVLFSDISQLAYAILNQPEMKMKWREKITEVMIDEYQDTTRAQEELFATFGHDKLFLVGDMKQAIYRFRQSDPLLFAEKNTRYRQTNEHTVIDLNQNFRSRNRVLQYINEVFEPLMDEQVGEMKYDDNAKLYFGLESYIGLDDPIELLLVDKAEDENPYFSQVQMIITEIKQLIQSQKQVFASGKTRPIEYSDIAILTRNNTSQFLDVLVEELQKHGIPFEKEGKTKFHAHLEVIWLIAILQLLDNPLDDIHCATVLKSPFGNVDMQVLYQIAKQEGASLYEKARLVTDEAVVLFFKRFDAIRAQLFALSPTQIVRTIIREFQFEYAIESMSESIHRKQNIEIIYELSREIETSRQVSFTQYIGYLVRQIEQDQITINTPILSETKHAVTIQTFHKSKGLEYPVVFVANTHKKFNLQTDESMYKLKTAGIVRAYHETKDIRYQTLESLLCKDQLRHESLSEEMRLFYVALTRAREKLYITGHVDSDKEIPSVQNRYQVYPYHMRISAQSMLDWILLSLKAGSEHVVVKYNHRQAEAEVSVPTYESKTETVSKKLSDAALSSLAWEDVKKVYQDIPLKLSVTELKKKQSVFEQDDTIVSLFQSDTIIRPKLQQTELSSSEVGTATHTLFEHLDLTRVTQSDIESQIQMLVLKRQIKAEIANMIHAEKIARFLESDFGQKIVHAREIKREVPFRMLIDAKQAGYQDVKADILVQGVIDVLLIDELAKQVVIVDYKTDSMHRFSSRDMKRDQLKRRYEIQASLYAEAIKRIYEAYDVAMYFVTLDDTAVYMYQNGEFISI